MLKNQRKDTYNIPGGSSGALVFTNFAHAVGIISIARAEFTIAPLLQVPPASRGEPRTGSVPPARRGNLKEGVFNRACFCKLCPPDRYKVSPRPPRGQEGLWSAEAKLPPMLKLTLQH
jgi:hypothetical protein